MTRATRPVPEWTPAVAASVPALLAELEAHGYTEAGLTERLAAGASGVDYPNELGQPLFTVALGDEPLLDVLLRALILGQPVARARLDAGLSARAIDALLASGLAALALDDGTLRCRMQLFPFRGLWLTCDLDSRTAGARDTVWRPDYSALTTLQFLAPRPGEPRRRVLDIGTGCGVLALSAISAMSAFGDATATVIDLNPRAVAFARFNAALNGMSVQGEVAGVADFATSERFDLITFSLPVLYAMRTGDSVALHADDGDRLLADVYARLPALLSDGGRAVLYHQIRIDPPGHFADCLRQAGVADALEVTWIESAARSSDPFGCALVRRRGRDAEAGAPSLRLFHQPHTPVHLLSRDIVDQMIDTQRALEGSADQFGAAIPSVPPDVAIYRALASAAAGLVETSMYVAGAHTLDGEMVALMRRCDGRSTVREIASRSESTAEVHARIAQLARMGLVMLLLTDDVSACRSRR